MPNTFNTVMPELTERQGRLLSLSHDINLIRSRLATYKELTNGYKVDGWTTYPYSDYSDIIQRMTDQAEKYEEEYKQLEKQGEPIAPQ